MLKTIEKQFVCSIGLFSFRKKRKTHKFVQVSIESLSLKYIEQKPKRRKAMVSFPKTVIEAVKIKRTHLFLVFYIPTNQSNRNLSCSDNAEDLLKLMTPGYSVPSAIVLPCPHAFSCFTSSHMFVVAILVIFNPSPLGTDMELIFLSQF